MLTEKEQNKKEDKTMNDFFDKLGAAARRAADTVSTEVGVAAQEQRIREAYQALGKLCYKAHKEGVAPVGAEFDACYDKIDLCMKRIDELRDNQKITVEPTPEKTGPVTTDVTAGDEDFVLVEE